MTDRCPTCGQAVKVVSSDEGTSHYEAVDVVPKSLADELAEELMAWVGDYADHEAAAVLARWREATK